MFKWNPFTHRLDYVGSGDVVGPGSSTDNALVRWDGTTGTMIKDGTCIETDTGQLQTNFGSNTDPAYSFLGATDCGLFTDGTNTYLSGAGFATLSVGFNVTLSGGITNVTQGVVKSSIVSKNSGFTTAYNEYMYVIDTSGGGFTAELIGSPIAGQEYIFKDDTNSWGTSPLVISGVVSGKTIDGATTLTGSISGASITLKYNGAQWNVI